MSTQTRVAKPEKKEQPGRNRPERGVEAMQSLPAESLPWVAMGVAVIIHRGAP